MANPLTNERAQRIMEERLAVLNGDRGDPLDYALRRRELQELQAFIGQEVRRLNVISATITALDANLAILSGNIPPITAQLVSLDARVDVLEAGSALGTFGLDDGTATASGVFDFDEGPA